MKKKLQKISILMVGVAMFAGVLLLSMERNTDGNLMFAPAQSFAQSESGGGESGGSGGCYFITILECPIVLGQRQVCNFTGVYGSPYYCTEVSCFVGQAPTQRHCVPPGG